MTTTSPHRAIQAVHPLVVLNFIMLLAALLLWARPLHAQTKPAKATAPVAARQNAAFDLKGNTLDGKPFSMQQLKGKVVLVFFWSTDCAVCRSKMPELRANYDGWRGKSFELVTVSVDKNKADLLGYTKLVSASVPNQREVIALWSGDPGYADTLGVKPAHLPLSLVIRPDGKVAARFEGRIPAEAWDTISELLP